MIMSLLRVFRRGTSSTAFGRSSRRRSRSTRLHLFVDRLEDYTPPNVVVPGSLAIGFELATSAAAASALAAAVEDSVGDRGHSGAAAKRLVPSQGPLTTTDLGARGSGRSFAASQAN